MHLKSLTTNQETRQPGMLAGGVGVKIAGVLGSVCGQTRCRHILKQEKVTVWRETQSNFQLYSSLTEPGMCECVCVILLNV